ncbi:MAG: hypothetical protein QME66_05145 [Candidatus Eisenbacteria bacterium]|nr:hypothetical protein [Candidatus Eisenbacteria bacterium]
MRSHFLFLLSLLLLVSWQGSSFSAGRLIAHDSYLVPAASHASIESQGSMRTVRYRESVLSLKHEFAAQRAIKREEKKEEQGEEQKSKEARTPPNPGGALFLSLAMPGTGEIYAQRSVTGRSLVFWGVEAVGWVTFFSFRASGKAEEREYKRFADEHWDWARYRNTVSTPDDTLASEFLGELYEKDKGEFYEEIGKDNRFIAGWDTSLSRTTYLSRRDKSNSLLRTARYATMGLLLNRVASALDALILAKRGMSLNVSVHPATGEGRIALKKTF